MSAFDHDNKPTPMINALLRGELDPVKPKPVSDLEKIAEKAGIEINKENHYYVNLSISKAIILSALTEANAALVKDGVELLALKGAFRELEQRERAEYVEIQEMLAENASLRSSLQRKEEALRFYAQNMGRDAENKFFCNHLIGEDSGKLARAALELEEKK